MAAYSEMQFLISAVSTNSLAMSNCVYVSPSDAVKVCPYEVNYIQLSVDDMIYLVRSDASVNPGEMAFNKLQRQVSGLSTGVKVSVRPYLPSNETNMNLSYLRLEVELLGKVKVTLQEDDLVPVIREIFSNLIFCRKHQLCLDFKGTNLKFTVLGLEMADVTGDEKKDESAHHGFIMSQTSVVVEAANIEKNPLTLKRSAYAPRSNIFDPTFKFEEMGIGGLDKEFGNIFRRAFASRTFPATLINKLGLRHVKGILLHGPPGTGKTLIARQIGKMLKGREPKIVNGPEILNKFVGQAEENIRKLFLDAEEDQKANGDDADLHIIIFDEMDAICKQRGSVQSSAGVHDTVVNQLLSKMDGVSQLNNVLVIGMTNRKDMIDEALLRPGRFEVHVEIGLPDEPGRLQILKIHTKKMSDANFLGEDVHLPSLAAMTKNFSGAEIEGLVKSAASYAFYGSLDVTKDSVVPKAAAMTQANMMVTMAHFEHALQEVKPAFGVEEEELKKYLRGGFINYGEEFSHLLESCKTLIEQVRTSPRTPLLSVLLQGSAGSGKTALAAYLSIASQFPFVKMLSAEDMIGWGELEKAGKMNKIFRDAYKSPLSIIIIDDIERLLEYVPIGPRFSNTVLQALLVLLKKAPPHENRKLLIIGTTSNQRLMDQMQFRDVFNVVFQVPEVKPGDEVRTGTTIDIVFEAMQVPVSPEDLEEITQGVTHPVGIKQLLMVIEMASQQSATVSAARFFECMIDCGLYEPRALEDHMA